MLHHLIVSSTSTKSMCLFIILIHHSSSSPSIHVSAKQSRLTHMVYRSMQSEFIVSLCINTQQIISCARPQHDRIPHGPKKWVNPGCGETAQEPNSRYPFLLERKASWPRIEEHNKGRQNRLTCLPPTFLTSSGDNWQREPLPWTLRLGDIGVYCITIF